ncbi:MAG: hypothetical protein KGH67_01655 [Candidatus Micrarchaeota archaeon]|nr:hypothetical protein [Candidatus Micrarchaeota archaeon]MDE1859212.1 hypothetical protein [Candidatus Micrarchaeota archaeon]
MKNDKLLFAVLLLGSTLLGSVGQLLFKMGVDSGMIYTIALYVMGGVIAYGIATVVYLYILGRSHLIWTYGFVGFSYIFTTIFAYFILGESVGPLRWLGVMVIALGTALIGIS